MRRYSDSRKADKGRRNRCRTWYSRNSKSTTCIAKGKRSTHGRQRRTRSCGRRGIDSNAGAFMADPEVASETFKIISAVKDLGAVGVLAAGMWGIIRGWLYPQPYVDLLKAQITE